MKVSGGYRLLIVAATLAVAAARPQDDNLRRKTTGSTPIGDSIKMLTNQLMNLNATTPDIHMDTRTPPRLKQQVKDNQQKKEAAAALKESKPVSEFSYPGIAIPVDELSLVLEDSTTTTETTKKPITTTKTIPTTDSGISTWILLTSQSTTAKPTRKTMIKIKPEELQNLTTTTTNTNTATTEKPSKTRTTIKMRPFSTSTKRPSVTSTIMVDGQPSSTSRSAIVKDNKIITKIKASVLNDAQQTTANQTEKSNKISTTLSISESTTPMSTTANTSTMKTVTLVLKEKHKEKKNVTDIDNEVIPQPMNESSVLPLEAKDGSIELSEEKPPAKRGKRPNSKRKKNKNRRNRPQKAQDKMDTGTNSTKVAKVPKEKPIGTQIYNYLSREVMPTVGVGLVGLMVTAGLASYFLFPFGAARRTFDSAIDRKDDGNSYYYDYNSGGLAEEDVIGQVIAGMPQSSSGLGGQVQGSYRSPYSSQNSRYRPAEKKLFQTSPVQQQDYYTPQRGYSQPEPVRSPASISSSGPGPSAAASVSLTDEGNRYSQPVAEAFTAQRPFTGNIVAEHSKETAYTVDDKQFVVGNVPKELLQEEVTPMAVPEHGPRAFKLKRRKRRSTKKALSTENEISVDEVHDKGNLVESTTMEEGVFNIMYNDSVTNSTADNGTDADAPEKSFLRLVKDIIEMKIRMGLQILQNTTNTFSRYLDDVQKRLQMHSDEHKEEKHSPR